MLFDQVTIVGVGLIGGSVGLAAKARGVARRVVGLDRGPLATALRLGAIDRAAEDIADAVRGSDLVVVCTPVDRIAGVILRAAPHCEPGTFFTDGGSTKAGIVAAVEGRLPSGISYVPAHPLAGAEKNGVENARTDLFDGRVTILTPHPGDEDAEQRVEAFWAGLGSRVVRMRPAEHDHILAATSHLPHAVAAAVAGVTPVEYLPLSAGGFRDTTRIAAGDPELWAAIFRANRDEVLAAVDRFTLRLGEFRRVLEAGDGAGLVRWLAEAKQVRDALGTGNPAAGS
jgi:prephenate dehydrogenase